MTSRHDCIFIFLSQTDSTEDAAKEIELHLNTGMFLSPCRPEGN